MMRSDERSILGPFADAARGVHHGGDPPIGHGTRFVNLFRFERCPFKTLCRSSVLAHDQINLSFVQIHKVLMKINY